MPKEFYVGASMDGGIWINADSAEEAKAIADRMSKAEWTFHMDLQTYDAETREDIEARRQPEWLAQQKAGVA